MKKHYLFLLLLFLSFNGKSQVTLTHNIGTQLVDTSMWACSFGGIEWARSFVLEDFGIAPNEAYIIHQGQVGFSSVGVWDVNVSFNIYEIDENFPASFDRGNLIGSSQIERVYQSGFQLFTLEFEEPVVVPAGVARILVEVRQEDSNSSGATAFIAGTAEDNDFSWYNGNGGCPPDVYTTTEDIGRPDSRYYINVTGETTLSIVDTNSKTFTLAPNPVEQMLFLGNIDASDDIRIYNIMGNEVLTRRGLQEIDISTLASGIYFLEVGNDSGKSFQKFIKK